MTPEELRARVLALVTVPRERAPHVAQAPQARGVQGPRTWPASGRSGEAQAPRQLTSQRLSAQAPRQLNRQKAPASPLNYANLTTLAGYAAGVWWIAGGPAWAALASILADEADGVIARQRNEQTSYGAEFDWGVDIILTALTLRRLRAPLAAIPAATVVQVYLKDQGYRPPVGSLRAVLMLAAVVKEAREKQLRRALR